MSWGEYVDHVGARRRSCDHDGLAAAWRHICLLYTWARSDPLSTSLWRASLRIVVWLTAGGPLQFCQPSQTSSCTRQPAAGAQHFKMVFLWNLQRFTPPAVWYSKVSNAFDATHFTTNSRHRQENILIKAHLVKTWRALTGAVVRHLFALLLSLSGHPLVTTP